MSAAYDLVEKYVIDDTGRPDKAVQDAAGSSPIMRRIRRAVLAMHRMDFWKKDFIEQIYIFEGPASMIQAIDTGLLPRFRAMGYIRKWDQTRTDMYQNNVLGAPKGSSFDEINPEKMLDGYAYDKQDVMYRSGQLIKLNSSIPITQVLMGWFQDPLLDPISASDSWILKDYPDLIAAIAKRRIFKDIGKDDESKAATQEAEEEILRLQTNNITLVVM